MNRWKYCLLAILLLAGCKPAPRARADAKPVPVSVSVAEPETISDYLKLTGGIEAEDDAIVYSKITERLDRIQVSIGQTVVSDQVLAVQYNEDLVESVSQTEATVRSAMSQYKVAKADYERMLRLFGEDAISRQQFDQAEAQFESAESGLDQARAALKVTQALYEDSFMKAPFAGKVAMINFYEGDMVTAGQPVIKIINAQNVKTNLAVPTRDMSRVKVGQPVLAIFPASGDTLAGRVTRVDQAIDPATRMLGIEVRIPNASGRLKSGQFGQFMIETGRHENTVVVPDVAVTSLTEVRASETGEQMQQKRYYVFLVQDGKAVIRDVTPGFCSGGLLELAAGVDFGDSVVVVGQNIVRDGGPVRVVSNQEVD